jgi:hypothetical protein
METCIVPSWYPGLPLYGNVFCTELVPSNPPLWNRVLNRDGPHESIPQDTWCLAFSRAVFRPYGNVFCTELVPRNPPLWKRVLYRVGPQESTSMETCFVPSCFLETAYMSQSDYTASHFMKISSSVQKEQKLRRESDVQLWDCERWQNCDLHYVTFNRNAGTASHFISLTTKQR